MRRIQAPRFTERERAQCRAAGDFAITALEEAGERFPAFAADKQAELLPLFAWARDKDLRQAAA